MLNFWNRENKWDGKQKGVVQKRPDPSTIFLPSPQKEEDDGNKGQRRWMEGLVVSEMFRQAQAAVRLF